MAKLKKLKIENEQLRQDIITLLEGKDFMRILDLKARYTFMKNMEHYIWYGNPFLKGIEVTDTPKKVKVTGKMMEDIIDHDFFPKKRK